MRIFQIVVFVLASVSFLVSLYFAGTNTGDSFWKGGMAGMIGDIVLILLWPTGRRKQLNAEYRAVHDDRENEK